MEETEDFGLREICRTVQAEVELVEVKQQITARIRQFTDLNKDRTGLPKGSVLRVLNAWVTSDGELRVVAEKYKNGFCCSLEVKVTLYDQAGYPVDQIRISKTYKDVGDINQHQFFLRGFKNYRITTD